MKVLQIKWEHAKKLLEGTKTTSIRLGVYKVGKGEVLIHSCGRIVAKARVVDVEIKRIRELTDEDAMRDGFKNKDELLKALRELYGHDVSPNKLVTVIKFDKVERLEGHGEEDPYRGIHPQVIAKRALQEFRESFSSEEIKILEMIASTGSIRETAQRLFGSWRRRYQVRSTIRRALDLLLKRGYLEERVKR